MTDRGKDVIQELEKHFRMDSFDPYGGGLHRGIAYAAARIVALERDIRTAQDDAQAVRRELEMEREVHKRVMEALRAPEAKPSEG